MRAANTWTCRYALALVLVIAHLDAASDDRDFHGVVSHVFDGDSFVVQTIRGPTHGIEVRLMDIDAPEKDQPHADAARSALAELIRGQRVVVDVVDIDQYGRQVAQVYRDSDRLDIARILIERGHVWVNRRFAKDPAMIAAEDTARARHVGLWSLPEHERTPPWEFRRRRRAESARHSTVE